MKRRAYKYIFYCSQKESVCKLESVKTLIVDEVLYGSFTPRLLNRIATCIYRGDTVLCCWYQWNNDLQRATGSSTIYRGQSTSRTTPGRKDTEVEHRADYGHHVCEISALPGVRGGHRRGGSLSVSSSF